jgi:uncharacterized protein YkwD
MKSFSQFLHHLFIPHEHNNFRARVTQVHALASYLLFFMAMAFFINYIHSTSNVLGYATDITVDKLFSLTNEQRQENGLKPLKYNDKLAEAAKEKAADMFTKNYWAHFAPDGSTTPWSFILKSGYKYEYAGENLAKNFMFSDGVVQAWMKSPSHRENMLRPEYTDVGFAIANGSLNGEETTLVVQMFGKPLSADNIALQNDNGDALVKSAQAADQPAAAPQTRVAPAEIYNKQQPASQETSSLSWTRMFYNTNVLFLFFLIMAFMLDMFVAVKMDIVHVRFGGKTLIHVLFLLFILSGIVIIAHGKIL